MKKTMSMIVRFGWRWNERRKNTGGICRCRLWSRKDKNSIGIGIHYSQILFCCENWLKEFFPCGMNAFSFDWFAIVLWTNDRLFRIGQLYVMANNFESFSLSPSYSHQIVSPAILRGSHLAIRKREKNGFRTSLRKGKQVCGCAGTFIIPRTKSLKLELDNHLHIIH